MTPSTDRSMLPVSTTSVSAMPTMSGTALASAMALALAHVKKRGLTRPTPRHSASNMSSGANWRTHSAESSPRRTPARRRRGGDSVTVDRRSAALRGGALHPLPDVVDLVVGHHLHGAVVVLL